MKSKFEADETDWKILELLQENARLSNTQMGKQVGLSQPAVTARIQKLEDVGVIESYTARLNPGSLGREIGSFIRLKTTHSNIPHCLKTFEQIPQILEVYRITGEDCFLVKAVFQHMSELESAINTLGKFGAVTTAMVLASYPPRPLTGTSTSLDSKKENDRGGLQHQ